MKNPMPALLCLSAVAAGAPAQDTRFIELTTLLGAPVRAADPGAVGRPVEAAAGKERRAASTGAEIGVVVDVRVAAPTAAGDRGDEARSDDPRAGETWLVVHVVRDRAVEAGRFAVPLRDATWHPRGAWLTVPTKAAEPLSDWEDAAAEAAPGTPETLSGDRIASALVRTADGETPPVEGLVFDLQRGTLAFVLVDRPSEDITPSTPEVRVRGGTVLLGEPSAVVPWPVLRLASSESAGALHLRVPLEGARLAAAPRMSAARAGKLEREAFRSEVDSWWQEARHEGEPEGESGRDR